MLPFPHPLYQCLYKEPRLVLPEEAIAIVLILPPVHELPSDDKLDTDYLASHVLPVVPVNVLWPKPRSSLSASSVLSRITSPRSEPPNRYQKSLPVKPRSQSLIGQSQPHPTHLIPSSPDGNTTNKRKTFLTMNDKVVYTGNNQVTTGRGFSSIMKASIVRIRHSFVQLGHIKANHHYSTTPHKQQQQQQQNDQQKQRRRAISTSESRPALSVPLLLVYVDKALLTQKPCLPIMNKSQTRFQGMLDELDGQLFPALTQLVQDASDQAIQTQDLDTLHNIIETLLEKGIETLHTAAVSNSTLRDRIHAEFESYVMEQTYDVVFFKITQVVLTRDLHLSEVIEQIKHVDVTQLGLPTTALNNARHRVKRAVTIFQNIATFRTPSEKLDCILATIYALSSTASSDSVVMDTSDTLVPLLLLTVIQSQVPHLIAHFTYMKEYTFELDVIGGKFGFALSTLEGVVVYLAESATTQLATVSRQNLQLWRYLKASAYHQNDLQLVESLYYQCHPSYSTSTLASSAPSTPMSAKFKSSGLSFVIRDRQGNTPLLLACRSGQLAYIPFLAKYEHVTAVANDNDESTLMMAVRSGSVELVGYLLDQYQWTLERLDAQARGDKMPRSDTPSPSFVDAGRTAIHLATWLYGDSTLLERLVRGGATLDKVDHQGNGPLHLACIRHEQHTPLPSSALSTIDYLLQHLPTLAMHRQNANGDTFFHLCPDQEQLEKHQSPVVDTVNRVGRSPWLEWAARGRFSPMISLIDHHNVNQFRLDYQGRSGLHYVASQLYLLEQVLWEQHPLETNGGSGDRASTSALEVGIKQLVYSLRDLVYVRDRPHGNTPLHMATLSSKTKYLTKRATSDTYRLFIEALWENGADMNACNHAGERPIDLCDGSILHIMEALCLKAKPKASSDPSNALHQPWALTRVMVDPIRYVVKSGRWMDPSSMTTVERTWDDFLFLRQEILHELPESFLPILSADDDDECAGEHLLLDPNVLDLGPPPLVLLQKSLRRLDQFMDYLQRHPALRKLDQVRSFVRTPHLNKAAIHDKSYSKRNLMIEKLGARLPPTSSVDDFDEVYFLKYTQGMIRPLKDGLSTTIQQAHRVVQCQQGFKDALNQVTHDYDQLTWLTTMHQEAIKICAGLACNTLYVCPLLSLVDTLETMSDTSNGVMFALDFPFTLLKRKSDLIQQLEKQRDALQKGQHPSWNGLFSSAEQTKQVEREKENIAKTLSTLGAATHEINQSHQMISDELAHYQGHHSDDLTKSIRSYARRQLKMEKLKLRWLTQTWLDVYGGFPEQ